MRQVPYTIIGNGRAARHFCHYLSLLKIPYRQWFRSSNASLEDTVNSSANVFLLISDSAIEYFIKTNACLMNKRCVHFSGSLVTELAYGAHPLMTFGPELYTLEEYQKIPWIIEKNAPSFSELFPELPNESFLIDTNKKAYYHALCVISNNFTTLLWKKFINQMEKEFDIPKAPLIPILQRTMKNITENHEAALTGPLMRGDQKTIETNLNALEGDAFRGVYQAFVNAYQQEKKQ